MYKFHYNPMILYCHCHTFVDYLEEVNFVDSYFLTQIDSDNLSSRTSINNSKILTQQFIAMQLSV